MDIGATLRHAREARKLSVQQIAAATRIPLRLIEAIEKDDWARVPAGIFARGYLKAYAREVRIDDAPLVAQYEAEHAPPPDPAPQEQDERAGQRMSITWPRWNPPSDLRQHLQWPALAAAALLLLFAFAGRAWIGGAEAPGTPVPAPIPISALGTDAVEPVGTAASAAEGRADPTAQAPSAGDRPFAVEIAVTRPCWITLTVDGVRKTFRLVQPGEREREQGRVFVVRAGDAGAVRLSLDGQPARPVGLSGQVVTVRVTRENYKSLLQPAVPGRP